jgi:hypothetical protein
MKFDHYVSNACRVFFLAAFVLLGLAVAERAVNVAGYTLLGATGYAASRLLEFAVILLVFVIALLLRQIRDELRSSKREAVSPPL